jgi:hypothetical protein
LILYNNECVTKVPCPSGFYGSGTSCIPVDSNCVRFDYNNNVCSFCATNLIPQGPSCITDPNSDPCPNNRTWYNSISRLCVGIS